MFSKIASAAIILLSCLCAEAGERIISLAPSITETLFALGAGPEVVGVSRYCKYPAEVEKLPKAGGFIDPDYETILRLRPTFVAITDDNPKSEARFKTLGIKYVAVGQRSVDGILKSFETLGVASGHADNAKKLVESAKAKLAAVRAKTAKLPRPRTLVCMGRSMGGGIREVFAVGGSGSFYSELLDYAGADNVCANSPMKTPTLSAESLIRLNPEVIIDMAPPRSDVNAMRHDWDCLKQAPAVEKGRVYVLAADYVQIPGPRFLLVLDEMVKAAHPELQGQEERK